MRLCNPPEALSWKEIGLPPRLICYYTPPIEAGVLSPSKINGFFFHGDQVIKPENIIEMDTAVNRIWKKLGWVRATVLYRDLLRQIQLGVQCFIVGIEEQSAIDYTIPLRVMGYDIQGYEKQLKKLKKQHKIKSDLTGDEFLSGISKTDRLKPIVTIVIYFGESEWDGPIDLHGMLALEGLPSQLRKSIPNYPIHILDVRRYNHTENFQTDIRILFNFLRNALDKNRLKDYIEDAHQKNIVLSDDTYDMICLMSDMPDMTKLKEKHRNEREEIVMCKAWDELLTDTREAGKFEGIQLAAKVIGLSFQGLDIPAIARECSISETEVQNILRNIAA